MKQKKYLIFAVIFLLLASLAHGQLEEGASGGGVSIEDFLNTEYIHQNFVIEIKHSDVEPSESELNEFEKRILLLDEYERRRLNVKVTPKCIIGLWVTKSEILPATANERCRSNILKYFEGIRGKIGLKVKGLLDVGDFKPVSLEENLANYKILQILQAEVPTSQELQELQNQVNAIPPPEKTGRNTCYVGMIYVKDRFIFIRANSKKCLIRISDHFSKNNERILGKIVTHQKNNEYQAILVYIKEEMSSALEKWQFGEKETATEKFSSFRIDAERNPQGESYIGLVGDGENTLTFNVFVPETKSNFLLIYPPSIGQIKIDDSLWDQGLVKVTYTSPKLCSVVKRSEEIKIERFERALFGHKRKVGETAAKFDVYRTPIFLVHGLWSDGKNFPELEKALENKFSVSPSLDFVYYFDYWAYNLDRVESLARRFYEFISERHKYLSNSLKIKPGNIDIVAHSMGGLVARSYIENDNLQGYKKVNKLVTLGTPHKGAEIAQILYDGCPSLEYGGPQSCQKLLYFVQAMRNVLKFSPDWGQLGPSVIQLIPHSGFLNVLNEKERLHEDKVTYVLIAGTAPFPPSWSREIFRPIFKEILNIQHTGQLRITREALSKESLIDKDIEKYYDRFVAEITNPNTDGTVPRDSALGVGLFDKAKRIERPFNHGDIVKSGIYETLFQELKECKDESFPTNKPTIQVPISS